LTTAEVAVMLLTTGLPGGAGGPAGNVIVKVTISDDTMPLGVMDNTSTS
jgi:hypothetical protein